MDSNPRFFEALDHGKSPSLGFSQTSPSLELATSVAEPPGHSPGGQSEARKPSSLAE